MRPAGKINEPSWADHVVVIKRGGIPATNGDIKLRHGPLFIAMSSQMNLWHRKIQIAPAPRLLNAVDSQKAPAAAADFSNED